MYSADNATEGNQHQGEVQDTYQNDIFNPGSDWHNRFIFSPHRRSNTKIYNNKNNTDFHKNYNFIQINHNHKNTSVHILRISKQR